MPSFTISHKEENADKLWPKFKNYDAKGFILLASSNHGTNDQAVHGVVQGHAYSVISIHELQVKGHQVRLMKMRNPWGQGEWNGDWSDNSNLWTPELSK
jgi:hypothetical protein